MRAPARLPSSGPGYRCNMKLSARFLALATAVAFAMPIAAPAQSAPDGRSQLPTPSATGVALVTHWPTGTIYNHAPQLRFQVNAPVRPASFHAWVDGKPVNGDFSGNAQWYYFASPRSLGMGNHTVRVRGITQRGAPFDVRWTFYQAAY